MGRLTKMSLFENTGRAFTAHVHFSYIQYGDFNISDQFLRVHLLPLLCDILDLVLDLIRLVPPQKALSSTWRLKD